MEMSGQLHSPRASPPWKITRCPLDKRLDGLQSRSGRCGENLPLPGIEHGSSSPQTAAMQDCAMPAVATSILRLDNLDRKGPYPSYSQRPSFVSTNSKHPVRSMYHKLQDQMILLRNSLPAQTHRHRHEWTRILKYDLPGEEALYKPSHWTGWSGMDMVAKWPPPPYSTPGMLPCYLAYSYLLAYWLTYTSPLLV
jgi:hypothetical protein